MKLSCSFIYVFGCIIVGLMGLMVEIFFYTVIVMVKSFYMLFSGWYSLVYDLISREGLFLEMVCVLIVGLVIFMWSFVVIGSIMMVMFLSFFMGLYGFVMVY